MCMDLKTAGVLSWLRGCWGRAGVSLVRERA